MTDPYQVLGVTRSASVEEIKPQISPGRKRKQSQ